MPANNIGNLLTVRYFSNVADGHPGYCIGNLLGNVVLVAHANNGTTCWQRCAGINVWGKGNWPHEILAIGGNLCQSLSIFALDPASEYRHLRGKYFFNVQATLFHLCLSPVPFTCAWPHRRYFGQCPARRTARVSKKSTY